jgi:hypothetical protein
MVVQCLLPLKGVVRCGLQERLFALQSEKEALEDRMATGNNDVAQRLMTEVER